MCPCVLLRGLPAHAGKPDLLRAQLRYWLSTYDRFGRLDPKGPVVSAEQRYYIWWPGHSDSKAKLTELLQASHPAGDETSRIGVPSPSLLLHMPALLESEVKAVAEEAGKEESVAEEGQAEPK